MKKILLKSNNSSEFDYFLLESKKITFDKAKSLVYKISNETEGSIIDEFGVQATNIGFWVIKRRKSDNKFMEVLHFENDKYFEIIEK